MTIPSPQPEISTLIKEDSSIGNAIEAKDVVIRYRSYRERPGTFKEHVLQFLKKGRSRYYETFNALAGVSFTIQKGTIVGFIGSNGAGKSTLLKVLNGVLKPTSGTIKVQGKVDSLIKLGAGFDKELNAVENIYLYGSLHRRPRALIKERVPKILEFAELTEFAHTPVRYYSSGMFARLGFSCALDMNPDVLLVDEVLAVGDERFRAKSREAMMNLLQSGKTIVLVSHNINMMQELCNKIGVLSKGRLIFFGDPTEAIAIYRAEDYEAALDGKRF